MKKTFYLLFFLIFVQGSFAQFKWEQITQVFMLDRFGTYNQDLTGYYLDVMFLKNNPDYGWISGFGGRVLRTIDGGQSWYGVTIPDCDQLESVTFLNESVGYVSGGGYPQSNGKIFKSTDGGINWINVNPPGVNELWGNFFLTPEFGVVIGGGCDGSPDVPSNSFQKFFRTTNGGNNWTVFTANVADAGLCDAILYSQNGLGYASSSGLLWVTHDGGVKWSPYQRTGGSDWHEELTHIGNSFLLPYSETCTGNGPDGGMRFSTDNGSTWKKTSVAKNMFGAFLLDSITGWSCGFKGSVYYTSDAGYTWENRNCGIDPSTDLDDMYFINDSTAFVVGRGIFHSVPLIVPKPEIIAEKSLSFCENDSVTLHVKGVYNKYRWSTGATTPSIIVKKSGKYWVTVENSPCEYSTSAKYTVYVYPKPNPKLEIVGGVEPCEGDTAEIGTDSNYPFILWSTGDSTKTTKITSQGDYSVTVRDSNGCETTKSIFIQFNPKPTVSIKIIGKNNFCVGDSAILEAVGTFQNYFWSFTDIKNIINTGSKRIVVKDMGKYFLSVENEYPCMSDPAEAFVDITTRNDTNMLKVAYSVGEKEFSLDSVHFPKIKCKVMKINNVCWRDVVLNDIYIFQNTAFSIPQSQFSIIIPKGGSADIMICYSPTALGFQHDTLSIPDTCSDHIIPLVGFSDENQYSILTQCNVVINLKTAGIDGNYSMMPSQPFPNPASASFSLPFIRTMPKNSQIIERCSLYNILGVESASSKLVIKEEQNLGDEIFQAGEFYFDTESLSSGLYFVILNIVNETRVFRVYIEK